MALRVNACWIRDRYRWCSGSSISRIEWPITRPMLSPYADDENASPSLRTAWTASNDSGVYVVLGSESIGSTDWSQPKRSARSPLWTGHAARSSWNTG